MANGKNKDSDAWDELDAADGGGNRGISPEIARALLNTNPAMRDGGMTTDMLVKTVQKNPKAGAAAAPAKAAQSDSFTDTAKTLEKRFAEAKSKRDREMAEADARFVAERKALLDAMTDWLVKHDPELRSPFTQQMLEQKKAFFQALGFDVKQYVASRMKR
jgi:hypothetical protein